MVLSDAKRRPQSDGPRFEMHVRNSKVELRFDLLGTTAINVERTPNGIGNVSVIGAQHLNPFSNLGPLIDDGVSMSVGHRENQVRVKC